MDMSKPYDGSGNLVEEIRCNSADEFLKRIEPESDELRAPDFTDRRFYRGHNDAGWKLLPSAWREDGKRKLKPLREWLAEPIKREMLRNQQLQQTSPEQRAKTEANAIQIASEVYAVRQFCDLADELGMLVPEENGVPELGSLITQLCFGYIPSGIFVKQTELFIDIPFAFAQHHGIPTRYLDWTRDPLVAAFFATDETSGARLSDDICVWAVESTAMPRVIGLPPERTPPLHWVRVPRGHHGYVHAQSGVFLLCGSKGQYQEPWSEAPHLPLQKYVLNRSKSTELRRRLYGLKRYSRAHLMPTLDNVSRTITEKWDWLSTPA